MSAHFSLCIGKQRKAGKFFAQTDLWVKQAKYTQSSSLTFCLLANVTPEIETTFITSCQCNAKKVKGYSDKILIKSLDHGVMYFKYDGQSFPQAFLFLVLSNHCIYKLSLGLDFQSKDMYNINCNEWSNHDFL